MVKRYACGTLLVITDMKSRLFYPIVACSAAVIAAPATANLSKGGTWSSGTLAARCW